ncbi:hypothetical protein AGMMS49957_12660 [Synergistales bacterium]|nr:hypothetical protein AGMMS49957_12660 [Synergistales bacterium]
MPLDCGGDKLRLITSHLNTDFDSLASMIAVQKLYPDAVICVPGKMERNVQNFVNRFGHLWDIQKKPSKIPMDQVTQMIVVDARSRTRIGMFVGLVGRQDVDVHVYDHHPPTIDDIPASLVVYEAIGAATTIIFERLLSGSFPITPEEATLFALAIYDDTGALTYDITTDRDIAALARLRNMNADMSMILSRVENSMPVAERNVLDALTENAEESYIHGAKVVTAWAESEEYVEGINILVHKLRDYCESHVTIIAVRCGKKTCLIARSAPRILNVKNLMTAYGGSGHLQAGSANITDKDPQELLTEITEKLPSMISPLDRVEDIMVYPVLAISPDSSVAEAYRTMLRFGHKALPVVRDGETLGMMTRHDLDIAHLHGFDRSLVKDFMTEGIIGIPVQASVNEAHRLMATYDFERLPVLSEGRLVGILTRTDLVRALHQTYRAPGEKDFRKISTWMEQIDQLMEESFTPGAMELLRRVGKKATELDMKAYIVGGAVRDILLGEKSIDIDISIEGDAETFVQNWNEPGCRVTTHGNYKTGTITFPDGQKIDVATARREFYEYAAALPEVESDSLKQDLGRRDFSINAMAVSLSEGNWGVLLDFYGGRRDLKKGLLRVLHNLSFVEDPTRVIRGARLASRLDMTFEDNTLRLLKGALSGNLLSKLSDSRVRAELESISSEKKPLKAARRMEDLGVWEAIFTGFHFTRVATKRMRRMQKALSFIKAKNALVAGGCQKWLLFTAILISDSAPSVQSLVMDKLHFSQNERSGVLKCLSSLSPIEQFVNSIASKKSPKNSEVYLFLKNYALTPLMFCWAATKRKETRRWITLHILNFDTMKGSLTGRDLQKMGYEQGSLLGDMLSDIRLARMNGEIKSREDEMAYIKESLMREHVARG